MLVKVIAPVDVQPGFSKPGFLGRVRRWIGPSPALQFVTLFSGILILWYFGSDIAATMHRLGIEPGFAFLGRRANFEIGESLIFYSSSDTYGRALMVGLVNTVNVAFFGCLLATLLGTALGVARMSGNILLSSLVRAYVELFRNTPLLLQLFLWSTAFHALPATRQAIALGNSIFLSSRGVYTPKLLAEGVTTLLWLLIALVVSTGVILLLRRAIFGQRFYFTKLVFAGLSSAVLILWLSGTSIVIEWPTKSNFNITGGLSLTPEFTGLLTGLVFNSAATIAAIVRSGIQSVGNGQWEAARSLGLRPGHIIRLVVLPQALRLITPLMTSSYLDLTKNSSLAVAIGFPDLVSVANTAANTTGQNLESITIIAGSYLVLNIAVSGFMNVYNRRTMLKGARR